MFDSIGIPHGFCFLWNPGLLWLHVVSDSLIALAYFLIPVVLWRILRARRDDIPHPAILLCFAGFILACGLTHVFEVITLWHPIYWVSGVMKAITALVSLATFILLARLAPTISALPSSSRLDHINQQLSSVLESTVACVYSMDRDWKLVYLNGNAKALLGAKEDLLGRTMFEAFPNQQPQTVAHLRQVMETRQPIEFESFYQPLDLSTKVSVAPRSDGGITIFFSDISAQKKLARALDLERALREQRVEALAHMAGGVAHEISNPLGIIHARASDLADLAREGEPISPDVVLAACESMIHTSERAIRVVRSLRMFASEGSSDPLQPTTVASLVEQSVELVRHRSRAQDTTLTIELPAEELPVTWREGQIAQILVNLFNNSLDAVKEQPKVDRWIKISVQFHTLYVTMDVLNGGPGIPPEHRPHLMKPFFTAKLIGPGIGSGLSVSEAVAHDHGGSLVLMESGRNSCFRLTLPRS